MSAARKLPARAPRVIPSVPVEYESAVRALEACTKLDETRYWSDKADALAAWAKIHHSNEVVLKAKALKLYAYRRMGEIAAELAPPHRKIKGEGTGRLGNVPGPRALLKSHGLSVAEADAARVLAGLPQRAFQELLKRPTSPTTARHSVRDDTLWRQVQATAMSLRSRFRQLTPAQVVASMTEIECLNALSLVAEVSEWLDDFDRRLRKKTA